jgi:hypothetical protein
MKSGICPVKLVQAIFQRVKSEKLPCSRHIVRIIPLQYVFYPDMEELTTNVHKLLTKEFGMVFQETSNKINEVNQVTTTESVSIDEKESKDIDNDHETDKKQKVEGSNVPVEVVESVDNQLTIVNTSDGSSTFVPTLNSNTDIQRSITVINPRTYSVMFKARNHNVLTRTSTQLLISGLMPRQLRVDYRNPKVISFVNVDIMYCQFFLVLY